MEIIAYISVLVCIIGLVMYLVCKTASLKEIGKIMFGAGLVVSLFFFGAKALHLGTGATTVHKD